MRIVTTLFSASNFKRFGANIDRQNQISKTLQWGATQNAHIIVLPAGVLVARHEGEADKIAMQVVSEAQRRNIAVIFGIDEGETKVNNKQKGKRDAKTPLNDPSLGFAWSPGMSNHSKFVQRCIKGSDEVLEASCKEARQISVDGKAVEILICGEMFHKRIREEVKKRNPHFVFDIGHISMTRASRTLQNISNWGCATLFSQHLKLHGGTFHCFNNGQKLSGVKPDCIFNDDIWIELHLWNIG